MGKQLDWDSIANVNFDDKRRKASGQMTSRELFAKAYDKMVAEKQFVADVADHEPVLKARLLASMVNKTPITVTKAFNNPTETLGGITKSSDDDGFYNTSPSANADAKLNARFEETLETIPAGIQLVYKSWDKQLGQWVFKGSNGTEYAIYDKPQVMFRGDVIKNPGLLGLLYNTDINNG